MAISDSFAKTYSINLPARSDRRRETNAMLKRVGLAVGSGGIEYFPATRPDSAGEFVSIGARGCFLSHLGALKKARDEGAANVLLMEDDLEIDPRFSTLTASLASTLRNEPWGFVYFGHRLTDLKPTAVGELLTPYQGPIVTAHFVGINGTVLPRLIDFLDTVLSRPGGHPDGGPMHVDGAYSTFRQQNPDVLTLVAQPSLGWQRSSKSDITTAWFDSVPGLNILSGLARMVKGKSRKLDATKQ
jgi:glycosyl transferase family 25